MTKNDIEIPIKCKGSRLVSFNKLKAFQGKLKELTDERAEELKNQIKELGWVSPVFVWGDDNLLDGHQRLLILPSLLEEGYSIDKIPVVDIDARSKTEAAKILLAINSHYGQITEEGLYEFMYEMELEPIDLEGLELPDINLDEFIEGYFEDESGEGDEGEDDVPEVPETPQSKLGDLYILNKHRVLCGDATKAEDVNKLMDGKKADMVFTDPPYGLGGYGGRKRMALKGDDQDVRPFYSAIPDVGEVYVWGRVYNLVDINFHPRDIIVWKKNNFGLGRGYRGQYEVCFYKGDFSGSDSDVWDISKDIDYKHPTQKPIALCVRAIANSKPQSILDLFLGSGSTLIASEKTGRICYGMELDPHYIDVIVQRWVDYTGQVEIVLNGKAITWKE